MPAISQKLRGLIGGVSQQPDSLKIDGQFRTCNNFYPDPTFGLIKRPGLQFTHKLANASSNDSNWFFISKGDDEKLILQITRTGGIKLWDAQSGLGYTVNVPSATAIAYATHSKFEDLQLLQINDYIFILNRTIKVEDDGTNAPSTSPYAYVNIETVSYDTSYTVTLDGVDYTYTSPTYVAGVSFSLDDILNGLIAVIPSATYYVQSVGYSLYIDRVDTADFSIDANGGQGSTAIKAYKGSVTGVEDLPSSFINDKIIEIAGTDITGKEDYYVKFETSDGSSSGAGIWVETIAPGAPLGIDATTMPHALIREADGTYTFRELSEAAASSYVTSTSVSGIPTSVSVTSNGAARWNIGQTFACYGGSGSHLRLRVTSVNATRQITGVSIERAGQGYTASNVVTNLEGDTFTINTVSTQTLSGTTWATQYWAQRLVGDDISNPSPSFVDSYITGISFFKNRLVLMSNENIICSVAGDFLNFYASTVITVIDSDPIDLSAGSANRIEFKSGIQESTGLLLFANNFQYILQTKTEAFSPSTAELNLVSSYTHTVKLPPVDFGGSIVVVEENNTSVAVNQLNIKGGTTAPTKTELSKVIPSYIPNEVRTTLNTLSVSLLGILTNRELESIYLFRYYTQENERLLASWFKWTYPANILMCEFHEDELFAVIDTDDGPVVCHSELMTETPGGAILFENKYVDLRLDLCDYYPSKAYDAITNETKIFLKEGAYINNGTACLVKISSNDSGYVTYPTIDYNASAPAGQKYYVTVEDDQTSEEYAIGYRITSEAQMPEFYIKRNNIADETNIPILHRIRLFSYESGPFEIELNVPGRNQFTLTLPQITSNLSFSNQAPMLRTAENVIPVMAKGTDVDFKIICNDPFPLALISLEWEGTYNNKGIRRV